MTSFENDIKPMFSNDERDCMLPIPMPDGMQLDLHNFESVKNHSMLILLEVAVGKMPMNGTEWNRQQIKLLAQWIDDKHPA